MSGLIGLIQLAWESLFAVLKTTLRVESELILIPLLINTYYFAQTPGNIHTSGRLSAPNSEYQLEEESELRQFENNTNFSFSNQFNYRQLYQWLFVSIISTFSPTWTNRQ